MTIDRLEMAAFGPFAGEVRLELASMVNHGLFLINGPTGSGKTSLLDAICFALYGCSSGDEREARDLRSHHAPEDRPTTVCLDFSLGGTHYRVRRWMSPRKLQTYTEKAVLEELGAHARILADKRADVNSGIQNLVRLNAVQFRQVIVLPQGRFRDFLVAGSNAREDILKSLFETHGIEDFSTRLSQRRQAEAENLAGLMARKTLLLSELDVDEASNLRQRIVGLEQQWHQSREQSEQCRQQEINSRSDLATARQTYQYWLEFDQARVCFDQLDAEQISREAQTRLLDQARSLATIHPLYLEQARLKAEHVRLSENLVRLDRSYQNTLSGRLETLKQLVHVESEYGLLPERQERLVQRKAVREALGDLVKDQELMYQHDASLRADKNKLADSQGILVSNTQRLADLQLEWNQKRSWEQCNQVMENGLRRMEDIVSYWQDALQVQQKTLDQETLRQRQAEKQELLEDIQSRLQAELELAQRADSRQVAVSLARGLQAGQPCPVCGSIEHPAPLHDSFSEAGDISAKTIRTEFEQNNTDLQECRLQLGLISERQQHLQAEAGKVVTTLKTLLAAKDDSLMSGTDRPKEIQCWLKNASSLDPSVLDNRPLPVTWPALFSLRQQGVDLAQTCQTAVRALVQLEKQLDAQQAIRAEQLDRVHRDENQLAISRERLDQSRQRLENERQRLSKRFQTEGGLVPDIEALDRLIAVDQAWTENTTTNHQQSQRLLQEQNQEKAVLESRLDNLRQNLNEMDTRLADARRAWLLALAQAGLGDEDSALRALLSPEQIQKHQHDLQEYRENWAVARSRLEDTRLRLGGKEPTELAAFEQLLLVAEMARNQAEQAEAHCLQILSRARELSSLVEELEQKITNERATLQSLTSLTRLILGQDVIGNYVNLQRYVLSVFLDEILLNANTHLSDMSRGRYSLVREDFATGKKRTGGLELYVLDNQTGLNRATESLSGGESFLSALSLALGLSAVVHERSGGIRLDTLFVDEGFGSLDEDALQDAMQVLGRIHEGGRIIGIISHVRELKERIPTQLVVEKGPGGSTVSWAG